MKRGGSQGCIAASRTVCDGQRGAHQALRTGRRIQYFDERETLRLTRDRIVAIFVTLLHWVTEWDILSVGVSHISYHTLSAASHSVVATE